MDPMTAPDPTAGEPDPRVMTRRTMVTPLGTRHPFDGLCSDAGCAPASPSAVAASTGASEDVEALACEVLRRWTDATGGVRQRDSGAALQVADWLAAREAAAFAAGEAAGRYDRACDSPGAPMPPYAPDYDAWRKR